jgi:hypothetical protein
VTKALLRRRIAHRIASLFADKFIAFNIFYYFPIYVPVFSSVCIKIEVLITSGDSYVCTMYMTLQMIVFLGFLNLLTAPTADD